MKIEIQWIYNIVLFGVRKMEKINYRVKIPNRYNPTHEERGLTMSYQVSFVGSFFKYRT